MTESGLPPVNCRNAYSQTMEHIMTEAAIELRGIFKSYDKKRVLTGLDLAVPKGSVLGLLGTNGAGKTTLIKCALGADPAASGLSPLARRRRLDLERRGQNADRLRAAGHHALSVDEGAAHRRIYFGILSELEPRPLRPLGRRMVASARGPHRHAFGWATPDGWPLCWRWATSRSC